MQLGASSEARDALDDVRFARDALRALPLRAVPDGFFERVTAAVAASDDGTMITNGPEVARAAVSDLAARRGHRRWYGIAAAAAAAALVIAVAVAPRDSQVHPNVATLSGAHAVQASVGNELVSHLAPAGVPARFEHQRAPEVVGVRPHPLALVEHRLAARRGKSVDDQAQRLAGRVRVDCFHHDH